VAYEAYPEDYHGPKDDMPSSSEKFVYPKGKEHKQ
jgi:hypothetical protein